MGEEAQEDVFEGLGYAVGSFRCPPESVLWKRENVIERGPSLVFPMTGVEILHPDARPIVTHSACVMFYNRGQLYRRRLLDRTGDRCIYFGLEPQTLHEILELHAIPRADFWAKPFTWYWGQLSPRVHLMAKRLFKVIAERGVVGEDAHEGLIQLAEATVVGASASHRNKSTPQLSPRVLDAVEDTLRYLVVHIERTETLAELGARVHLSSFHLARSFRVFTGMSLHTFRDALRVLTTVDRLDTATRLVDLAMEVGYCSHSHLTQAFRRVLNETPTQLRRRRKLARR